MLEGSKHIKKNVDFAHKILSLNSENYPNSLFSLSNIYEYGLGVDRNLDKAIECSRLLIAKSWNNTFEFVNFWPGIINLTKL